MCPQWFNHDSIPYDQMWVDDKLWYPLLLQGKRFNAFFKFQGLHKVIDYNIQELNWHIQSPVMIVYLRVGIFFTLVSEHNIINSYIRCYCRTSMTVHCVPVQLSNVYWEVVMNNNECMFMFQFLSLANSVQLLFSIIPSLAVSVSYMAKHSYSLICCLIN